MSLYTRQDRSDFALAMGVLCVGLGIPGLSAPDDGSRAFGALNLAIGALATAVGVAGLTGGPSEDDGRTVSAARFTLAAVPSGGRGGGGAALVVRF